MELRHLRYFVAVAEALNYRKASGRLHVSQPTLSHQIKDLESELGVRLLDRDTHAVRLTPAGSVFLRESRATLDRFHHAISAVRDSHHQHRESLVVGYFAPLLNRFAPAALKAFHRQCPAVEVTLAELPLGKQITAVKSGTVQIGFMLRESADPPCRLPHQKIIATGICAAFSRSHPLAALDEVSLADVARQRLVCLSSERGSPREHRAIMRRIFSVRGLKTAPIKEIEGSEALRATLESGLGVSLVAEIGSLSQSAQLVLKPLADTGDDLTVELIALWRDTPVPALIDRFLACLRTVARQEMRRPAADPNRIDHAEGRRRL